MKAFPAVLALTALALTGCSGDGNISLPTSLPSSFPSLSATPQPSPTDGPTESGDPGTPTPTATETTAETPTVTATATATATETVTAEPTPTATPPSSDATEPVATETDGPPAWVWLLLLLLAIGLIGVIVWAARRSSRRKTWDAQMGSARTEADWALQSLLPAMLAAPSAVEFQQAWTGGRDRFLAVDRSLFELTETAPDDARRTNAGDLKTGFDGLRQALDAEAALSAAGGSPDDLRAARAGVERARSTLANAATATPGPKHA